MRAVVYIPAGAALDRWLPACDHHAAARGYQVVSLARHWSDAARLVAAELAEVVVVATRGHLDPDRVPRLEVADEAARVVTPPGQRRPVPRR